MYGKEEGVKGASRGNVIQSYSAKALIFVLYYFNGDKAQAGSESELLLDPRESIHITNYEMIRNFFVLGKFLPVSCSSCHIRV
jgi:hypothetical protein